MIARNNNINSKEIKYYENNINHKHRVVPACGSESTSVGSFYIWFTSLVLCYNGVSLVKEDIY